MRVDETAKSNPDADQTAHQPGSVVFTIEQQRMAGIEIKKVTKVARPATRRTIGWLEVPSGREVIVRAPAAGFLTARSQHKFPQLGDQLQPGDKRVAIQTVLTPAEIAQLVVQKEDTDIAIEQSKVSMELAEAQLNRLRDARDSVSGIRIDELRDRFERSKIALIEAQEKLPFLLKEPYAEQLLLRPHTVETPTAGQITQIQVTAGQIVLLGDPLWTLSNWSQLWLKVAVFEDWESKIDTQQSATIMEPANNKTLPATFLPLPVATRPHTRMVDFLYVVDNPQLSLRPGQSLTIELPMKTSAAGLNVPRSAIIYDNLGNTFVYLALDETHFERRRIELASSGAEEVVVSRGLIAQERIVETGAQLLYAEEFKGNHSVGDDD